jgi:hypothetical protein
MASSLVFLPSIFPLYFLCSIPEIYLGMKTEYVKVILSYFLKWNLTIWTTMFKIEYLFDTQNVSNNFLTEVFGPDLGGHMREWLCFG